jgi:hypothetical protein
MDATPRTTKVALVMTLAGTGAIATVALAGGAASPAAAGVLLAALTALFGLRVGGQALVLLRPPAWLPPMGDWNLVPYRVLLPIQIVFLAVMGSVVATLLTDSPARHPEAASVLFAVGGVYGSAMAVRYGIRMRRRPAARWFGGAIPIVFHLVLATFVLTLGAYHAG